MSKSNHLKALTEKAISLLARREHGYSELKGKLALRGFAEQDIVIVLDELVAKNFLSDCRYVELILKTRLDKAYGPRYIQQELVSKGVSEFVINKVFQEFAIDWATVAELAWQKKYKECMPSTNLEKAKQQKYLLNRGFSYEQVQRGLEACYNRMLNSL